MSPVTFHYLWLPQMVMPTVQPTMAMQPGDTARALSCPVYTDAIRAAIYLVVTDTVTLEWCGGSDLRVTYPDAWRAGYAAARERWVRDGNDTSARFVGSEPLAAHDGGYQRHQGGMMVNFFTGLSVALPEGTCALVTRPVNSFHPNWAVQDGLYRARFPGDFSLNVQLMRQAPVTWRRGEAIASIIPMVLPDAPPFELAPPSSPSTALREAEAGAWYRRKAANGPGEYRRSCPRHRGPSPTG